MRLRSQLKGSRLRMYFLFVWVRLIFLLDIVKSKNTIYAAKACRSTLQIGPIVSRLSEILLYFPFAVPPAFRSEKLKGHEISEAGNELESPRSSPLCWLVLRKSPSLARGESLARRKRTKELLPSAID